MNVKCIERKKKDLDVYVPEQYYLLVQSVSQKNKYQVVEMSTDTFLNFKETAEKLRNFSVDSNGDTVRWLDVNEFCIGPENPFLVKFKYWHDDAYDTFDLMYRNRGETPVLSSLVWQRKLSISKGKYKDLMSMVESDLIPRTYHSFTISCSQLRKTLKVMVISDYLLIGCD